MPDIVQVNVSRGGLPKRPVEEAMITRHGVEGDDWAHPRIHGSTRKKVLIMAAEVIDELAKAGYPVYYGALGENLTIRGSLPDEWRPGQVWRAGDALLEMTEIRVPCSALDLYKHPNGRAIQDEIYDGKVARSGMYASVHTAGRVSPGAPFELIYQGA